MAPLQISKRTGAIQEWTEDYKEPEIGHRHISHLYALFPASQINSSTPALFEAARKTLERRLAGNPNAATEEANNRYKSYGSYLGGKSFGGWQSVWVSMMYLRLGDAEEAYKHLQYQLKYGLKNNFWGAAYQLDGTYGSSAVIAEMLLQSHTGVVHLLPALPQAWPEGSVSGLRARGGFMVDMKWKEKKVTEATIVSVAGTVCKLQVANEVKVLRNGKPVVTKKNSDNTIEFATQKGDIYKVVGL
jgi:alpha-L-fucosidase 2